MVLLLAGCAGLDGMRYQVSRMIKDVSDQAVETEDDRHVRKDWDRLNAGMPRKHHKDDRDLQKHESELYGE
jgi:hypothetical protein